MERWQAIRGYEGRYSVSTEGRIMSHERIKHRRLTGPLPVRNRLLRPILQSTGYLTVNLYDDEGMTTHSLHRLTATAFLPQSSEKTVVNHIDGVKTNNQLANLEWVTPRENCLHAYANGLSKPPHTSGRGSKHARFKGVTLATHVETGECTHLEGTTEIELHGFHSGCVSDCINGKRKTHKKHTFRRAPL